MTMNEPTPIRRERGRPARVASSAGVEGSVTRRFKLAAIVHHPNCRKFRVCLQWRHEPHFDWVETREQAWRDAAGFLATYPMNSHVNLNDPARRADVLQYPRTA